MWQVRKSMKGLSAAALGLALLAPRAEADGPKDSNPPAPANKMVPKVPGVGLGGGHGRRGVETRTFYRAVCKSGSHRVYPWFGTARGSLTAAYRDARRHERVYRGHEAHLEEVPLYPVPQHPGRPPIIIREKTAKGHGERTIDKRIIPSWSGR
jgi:hypothetical protein